MELRAKLKTAATVGGRLLKGYIAHEHKVGQAETLKEEKMRDEYMSLPGRSLKGSYGHVALPRTPSL